MDNVRLRTTKREPSEYDRVWAPLDNVKLDPNAPFDWNDGDEEQPQAAESIQEQQPKTPETNTAQRDDSTVVRDAVNELVECVKKGETPLFGDDAYDSFRRLGVSAPHRARQALAVMDQSVRHYVRGGVPSWWWDFRAAVKVTPIATSHVDDQTAALVAVWRWVMANENKIHGRAPRAPRGGWIGMVNELYLALKTTQLRRIIRDVGIDPMRTLRQWKEQGWIEPGVGGVFTRLVAVGSGRDRAHMVCVRMEIVRLVIEGGKNHE